MANATPAAKNAATQDKYDRRYYLDSKTSELLRKHIHGMLAERRAQREPAGRLQLNHELQGRAA